MRKAFFSVVLLAAAAFLAACGNDSFAPQHPAPMQQGEHAAAPLPAPQQAQQQDGGFSWGSAAAGAVGGYLLGKALSPSAPPPQTQQTQVIRETRYVTRPAPAPSVASPPTVKPTAPAFTAPAAPSPAAPAVPKPVTVIPKFTPPPSAPTKYSGPSSYGSVTQSRPSYSSAPSRSSPSRR